METEELTFEVAVRDYLELTPSEESLFRMQLLELEMVYIARGLYRKRGAPTLRVALLQAIVLQIARPSLTGMPRQTTRQTSWRFLRELKPMAPGRMQKVAGAVRIPLKEIGTPEHFGWSPSETERQ